MIHAIIERPADTALCRELAIRPPASNDLNSHFVTLEDDCSLRLATSKCFNVEHNWDCLSSMDSSVIAAVSALLGSTAGGITTFATTLLNQRYVAHRETLAKDLANREQLYSVFLEEV